MNSGSWPEAIHVRCVSVADGVVENSCEVVTAKTLERPLRDVEPLCIEQSSSKIAQTSAYTVQNVLCSNSGENPTIFHPLERCTTTAERASDGNFH